jgi:hypothetical protein
MLAQTNRPSLFLPITSLQLQHYHGVAHSFAQWQPSIPRIANSFRTLPVATGVESCPTPTVYPLCSVPCAPLCPLCSDLSALCVALLLHAFTRLRHHTRHVPPLSPVDSLDCAYFLSPRGCSLHHSASTPRPTHFLRSSAFGYNPFALPPCQPANTPSGSPAGSQSKNERCNRDA